MTKRGDIRNPDDLKRSQWNFSFLNGHLNKSETITPTDVDALLERNGFFFIFETKLPNGRVLDGQRICLERLAEKIDAPLLYIWGYDQKPEKLELYWRGKTTRYPVKGYSQGLKQICALVEWWWAMANRDAP